MEHVRRVLSVTVLKDIMEYSVISLYVLKGVVMRMVSVGNPTHAAVNLVGQVQTVQSVFLSKDVHLELVRILMNVPVIPSIKVICVMSPSVQKVVPQRMVFVNSLASVHARLDGKVEIVQNA